MNKMKKKELRLHVEELEQRIAPDTNRTSGQGPTGSTPPAARLMFGGKHFSRS
jgi:hypothetical protein